jgi:hypothetical protein
VGARFGVDGVPDSTRTSAVGTSVVWTTVAVNDISDARASPMLDDQAANGVWTANATAHAERVTPPG